MLKPGSVDRVDKHQNTSDAYTGQMTPSVFLTCIAFQFACQWVRNSEQDVKVWRWKFKMFNIVESGKFGKQRWFQKKSMPWGKHRHAGPAENVILNKQVPNPSNTFVVYSMVTIGNANQLCKFKCMFKLYKMSSPEITLFSQLQYNSSLAMLCSRLFCSGEVEWGLCKKDLSKLMSGFYRSRNWRGLLIGYSRVSTG